MFGWMNVDRGLVWYSRLLNLALKNLDEDEEGSGKHLNSNVVEVKHILTV